MCERNTHRILYSRVWGPDEDWGDFLGIGRLGEREGYRMGGVVILIYSLAQRSQGMRGTFAQFASSYFSPSFPSSCKPLDGGMCACVGRWVCKLQCGAGSKIGNTSCGDCGAEGGLANQCNVIGGFFHFLLLVCVISSVITTSTLS